MRSIQRCVASIVVTACLMAVSGCSGISSTKPIGEPVAPDEAKSLAGIWIAPEGEPLYVQHLVDNRLRLASVNWETSKAKFQLIELECMVTKDEGQLYVNLLSSPPINDLMLCSFVRVTTSEGDQLLVAGPKVEAFATAVRTKEIAGKVDIDERGTQVSLTPEGSQLDDFVTPAKAAEQFTIDKPLVLRRVKRFEHSSQ